MLRFLVNIYHFASSWTTYNFSCIPQNHVVCKLSTILDILNEFLTKAMRDFEGSPRIGFFSPRKLVKTKNFEKKNMDIISFCSQMKEWAMMHGYWKFLPIFSLSSHIYISTIVLPLYCSIYPVVLISKKFNQMVANSASLNIWKHF